MTASQIELMLRDLGLGKENVMAYPWNPSNSLNMCKEIEKRKTDFGLIGFGKPDTEEKYFIEGADVSREVLQYDDSTKFEKENKEYPIDHPTHLCDEFIFSRQ